MMVKLRTCFRLTDRCYSVGNDCYTVYRNMSIPVYMAIFIHLERRLRLPWENSTVITKSGLDLADGGTILCEGIVSCVAWSYLHSKASSKEHRNIKQSNYVYTNNK